MLANEALRDGVTNADNTYIIGTVVPPDAGAVIFQSIIGRSAYPMSRKRSWVVYPMRWSLSGGVQLARIVFIPSFQMPGAHDWS